MLSQWNSTTEMPNCAATTASLSDKQATASSFCSLLPQADPAAKRSLLCSHRYCTVPVCPEVTVTTAHPPQQVQSARRTWNLLPSVKLLILLASSLTARVNKPMSAVLSRSPTSVWVLPEPAQDVGVSHKMLCCPTAAIGCHDLLTGEILHSLPSPSWHIHHGDT